MINRFKSGSVRLQFVFLLFFPAITNAQANSIAQKQLLDSLILAFPNEDVVVLENKTEIHAFLEKKKANYTKIESETYMILKESGIDKLRNIEIPVYSEDKVDRSECYSVDLSGHKSYARYFGIGDRVSESFVFYDGGKVAKFEYMNLSVGSIVSYAVKVNPLMTELPSIHVISDYRPCLKSAFTVTTDKNITFEILTFNTDSIHIQKSVSDLGTRTKTDYHFSKIGLYKNEISDKGALHIIPHLYFFIKSYKTENVEITVNGKLDQLTNWYNENISLIVNSPLSPELMKIAKEITATCNDEKDKVKAIYYWVQENIRYIAFEAGRDGFVPRLPSDVLSKRYGDCKDMSSIIYGLTKAIGISTNLTWVGTRELPYSYNEHPFTFTDNHMITTYNYKDSLFVLDATSTFQPWGIPTSMIQTKPLLIRDNEGKFSIFEVPVYKSSTKNIIDTTYLQINGTSLLGKSTVLFNGYSKVDLYYAMHNAESEKEKSQQILKLVHRSGNNISMNIKSIKNLDTRDASSLIDYDFTISKHLVTAGNKSYLSMFLDPEELIYFDPKKRKNSYDIEYLQTNEHVIVLRLAEGTEVKEMPLSSNFENSIAKFEISYQQTSPLQIICTYRVSNKILTITPEYFKEYAELISQIRKQALQKITLIVP